MSARSRKRAAPPVVAENPLEGEQLFLDALFGEGVEQATPVPPELGPRRAPKRAAKKPDHYKIVSISLYTEDIERLEALVAELKRRGHHKANKSQVIRHALAQLDLDAVPKVR